MSITKIWTIATLFIPMASPLAAQSTSPTDDGTRTQTIEVYGNWDGVTTENIPTTYRHFFYNSKNQLIRSFEGIYQLGDNELTINVVEQRGDLFPDTYTTYTYDSNGNLTETKSRKYGQNDVYDFTWGESQREEANEYNANNQLTKKTTARTITSYVWQGNNCVAERTTSAAGEWSTSTRYSNFVEGKDNLPLSTFVTSKSPSNNRIGEYTYSESGKPLSYNDFKVEKPVTDESGAVVSGEKGAAYSKIEWLYDENDNLTATIISYYNAGTGEYMPNMKIEYTLTENGGKKTATYTYNNGTWYAYGSPTVAYEAQYDGAAATQLRATPISGEPNAIELSAYIPANAPANAVYYVYRDGQKIGTATTNEAATKLTYKDAGVVNGTYEYFIQTNDKNVSDPITYTFSASLPTPANISHTPVVKGVITENGTNVQVYQSTITWIAPESEFEILGYNVYGDSKFTETNQLPLNGTTLIKETSYDVAWKLDAGDMHNISVEAVYSLGKARSTTQTISMSDEGQQSQTLMGFQYLYGDIMGGYAKDELSKVHRYFYDKDNRLLRVVHNTVMQTDSPNTEVEEKAGDEVPYQLDSYIYNEKDQLTTILTRYYKLINTMYLEWTDDEVLQTFEYDENGKCSYTEVNRTANTYTWDGENLTDEAWYSVEKDGTRKATKVAHYSDFLPGFNNLPQHTIMQNPAGNPYTNYNRVIETTYDEAGNKIKAMTYKYGDDVVKDEEGNVTSASKGTPEYEETWTYEDGMLKLYEKKKWSTSNTDFTDYQKFEYVKTDKGIRCNTFSYTSGIGWTTTSTSDAVQQLQFIGTTAPQDLVVTAVSDKLNTAKITAKIPQTVIGSPSYKLYRDGMLIATVMPIGSNISYTDAEVMNGKHEYFLQANTESSTIGMNISNIASVEFNTEFPAVTEFRATASGKTSLGYRLAVEWDAPQTDYNIRGYNIYELETKDFIRLPMPSNNYDLITDTQFEFSYEHVDNPEEGGDTDTDIYDENLTKYFFVQTVYTCGTAMSEQFMARISDNEYGPTSIDSPVNVTTEKVVLYDLQGRRVNVPQRGKIYITNQGKKIYVK